MDFHVSALSEEVNRLKGELDAATQQRCQAAEQGLILLAQKEHLQQQLEETESRLECMKLELEHSRKTLNDLSSATRRQSRVDFEDEQDLLTLSVTREMEMSQEIHDLEMELKNLRTAYDQLVAENDKMAATLAQLQSQFRISEEERNELRSELRAMKLKDTQSLADYTDLEEENISLQKQLLQMKQAQVEFEALKHEIKRYQEETEILNAQLDEMTHLRSMAQHSLRETVEALQIEREKVHSLQREMDYRTPSFRQNHISPDTTSVAGLSSASLSSNNNSSHFSSNSGSDNIMSGIGKIGRRFSRTVLDSGCLDEEDESGCFSEAQNDLLSEIQNTEQRKFENALSQVEVEKEELRQQLDKAQTGLQLARRELHLKKEEIDALQSQIDVIMSIENETVDEVSPSGDEGTDDQEVERLKRAVRSQEHKYVIALKQISSLQQELKRCHELEQLSRQFASEEDLRGEIVRLKDRLAQRDTAIHTLESDVVLLNALASRTSTNLSTVYNDLHGASNELMRMYCLANDACGQRPARYVLEHLKNYRLHFGDDGRPASLVDGEDKEGRDLADVCRMAEALFYLVKHTSTSLVGVIQQQEQFGSNNSGSNGVGSHSGSGGRHSGPKDADELQQQITRLKSMLCTKREQVSTLRNVLRANKKTAEEALANLKTRYEHEKGRASETMSKLRGELKTYREEAATFTSLRALYAQKCDEYVTQLDEMQRRYQVVNDERNTFRSLLNISLAQKAELSRRLEDVDKTPGADVSNSKSKRRQNYVE